MDSAGELDYLTLQDTRYLTSTIEEVVSEEKERADWDSMVVERKR